jgi:hypothetical protein
MYSGKPRKARDILVLKLSWEYLGRFFYSQRDKKTVNINIKLWAIIQVFSGKLSTFSTGLSTGRKGEIPRKP